MYPTLQAALLAARQTKSRMCTCAAGCPDSPYADGPDSKLWCGCFCHLLKYERLNEQTKHLEV
jgi:hypothetical protein